MKTIIHTTALSLSLACGLFARDIPTAEWETLVNKTLQITKGGAR